jgi:hypothetical protein
MAIMISVPVSSLIRTLEGRFPSRIIRSAPLVAAAAAVPVVNPERSFFAISMLIYNFLPQRREGR